MLIEQYPINTATRNADQITLLLANYHGDILPSVPEGMLATRIESVWDDDQMTALMMKTQGLSWEQAEAQMKKVFGLIFGDIWRVFESQCPYDGNIDADEPWESYYYNIVGSPASVRSMFYTFLDELR